MFSNVFRDLHSSLWGSVPLRTIGLLIIDLPVRMKQLISTRMAREPLVPNVLPHSSLGLIKFSQSCKMLKVLVSLLHHIWTVRPMLFGHHRPTCDLHVVQTVSTEYPSYMSTLVCAPDQDRKQSSTGLSEALCDTGEAIKLPCFRKANEQRTDVVAFLAFRQLRARETCGEMRTRRRSPYR